MKKQLHGFVSTASSFIWTARVASPSQQAVFHYECHVFDGVEVRSLFPFAHWKQWPQSHLKTIYCQVLCWRRTSYPIVSHARSEVMHIILADQQYSAALRHCGQRHPRNVSPTLIYFEQLSKQQRLLTLPTNFFKSVTRPKKPNVSQRPHRPGASCSS